MKRHTEPATGARRPRPYTPFFAVLACLVLASVAHAVDVSGTITTTTWTAANSPYRVAGTITLPSGNTLTIEPGVDVLFDADVQFIVNGVLHAVGTEVDSIRFLKGTASEWGGIRVSGGDSSTIAYARISDGHADFYAGGVYASDSGTRLALVHTVISGNTANDNGGGLYVSYATVTLTNCAVSSNRSGANGAGMALAGGAVTLAGCSIENNRASIAGGGLYTTYCPVVLTSCAITGNSASTGGGLDTRGAPIEIRNCTVSCNAASNAGGGVWVSFGAPVTLHNTIIWGNTPQQVYNSPTYPGTVTATYTDVQSDFTWPGTGNINADPLFVNAAAGDYHLQATSPCINTGDPGSPPDLDGSYADMGAHPFDLAANPDVLTGRQANRTLSGRTYRVKNTVTVPTGNTLTIEPGVDVLFDADVQFIVQGALHAVGTETDSIRFIKGTANGWGGLRISSGDSSTITYARISGASVEGDGYPGIIVSDANTRLAVYSSVIKDNGGPGLSSGDNTIVSLTDCTVSENDGFNGGGLAMGGSATLKSCIISNNTGTYGGGVSFFGETTKAILTDCVVSGNTAQNSAGGVLVWEKSTVALANCVINGNTSGAGGGGLYVRDSTNTTLVNCTINDNTATSSGGALYVCPTSTVTLQNTILWGSYPEEIRIDANIADYPRYPKVTAAYCDIRDDTTWAGTGNINADPLFVNAGAGDYHLQATSPCINTGDPASPHDPDGTAADMGAFPFTHIGVYGTITTRTWTKANSPYRVIGTITVPSGNTLTIEPGVDVLFDADVQFIVQGALHAVGTETDSIRFLKGTASEWGGIRISGGDSSSIAFARISDCGATGVFVGEAGTRLSMVRSVVRGNRSASNAAGVYANIRSTVWLDHCRIVGNVSASGVGAGLFVSNESGGVLTDCVISDNVMNDGGGGGLYYGSDTASLTLVRCNVERNTASVDGGGVAAWGNGSLTLDQCVIADNSAGSGGGGLFIHRGSATLANCAVRGNIALNNPGGGISILAAATLTDCAVTGNTVSTSSGGGIYLGDDGTATLMNCVVADNIASAYGGGIRNSANNGMLTVTNCTLANNSTSTDGGGLSNGGPATLSNSIVWGNNPNAISGEAVTARYSDMQGGYTGTGNIDADPIFSTHPDSAYHLTGASPCIDAGDPASPKDPDSTQADMGAFYFHHVNAPPVWASRPDTSTSEGVRLTFAVSATDPDADTLTYAAVNLPNGATFGEANGTFAWTPDYTQSGEHDAIFSATDGEFTVYDTVRIAVNDVNRAPVWASRADTSTNEGVRLTFTVSATDPDADTLTYAAVNLPNGATFGEATGTFAWTPDYTQSGEHDAIFSVFDGEFAVYDTVRITVTDVNRAPVWAARPDTSTDEGVQLTFSVSATDSDGQALSYRALTLPTGASFDTLSHVFDWTPGFDHAGQHEVGFSVTDAEFTVYDTVRITVNDVNCAPVWASRPDTSTSEGVRLTFTVSATDPDGQTLSYRAPTLPTSATFDTSSHVFDWTPTYAQAGQYDVRFSVTDGEFTVYDTVRITVADVNRAPVWAARPDTSTSEGVALAFTVSATDPDADTLTYAAVNLPNGATFGEANGMFAWTPGFDQAGQYDVRFSVFDGEFTLYDTVRVTVTDANRAPVWASRPDTSTSEGVRLTFTVSATDPDGQTLSYRAPTLPTGAAFDTSSHIFDWTPGYDQAGQHDVRFSVTDGEFTVYDTVQVTVINSGGGPTPVSGTIATTTWTAANSPYRVIGTITVPSVNTLTIEPGVDVLFDADVQFIVQGRLQAVGTGTDSIRFIKGTSTEWMGIRIVGGDTSTIHYARISDGHADGGYNEEAGGAISLGLYQVPSSAGSRLGMAHVVISGNRSEGGGGGMRITNDASASIRDCAIINNVASAAGGGINVGWSWVTIENSVIAGNRCLTNEGGGIEAWEAHLALTGCTIGGNASATPGGGIRAVDGEVFARNVVLWGNSPDGTVSSDGAIVTATYSDIQGGYTGTGNIDADPIFSTHPDSAYHLTGASPCIDAGDPASPKDPDSTRADMGAFYFPHQANRRPVWASRADTSTSEGVRLTFTVSATDPDEDTLSYRAPTLPTGAAFDTSSHVFDWTPTYTQAGVYDVRFSVTDGEFTVYDTVQVTVINSGGGPTPVSGTIATTIWTAANSPYRVTGTITVPSGNTLTIEPGVDVLFDADVQFIVQGALHAVGAETDTIRLLPGNAAEWGALRIYGSDTSTIHYARISGAHADSASDAPGGGIALRSRLSLANAVISGNRAEGGGGGVWAASGAHITLHECRIIDNSGVSGGGVYIQGPASLSRCLIARNMARSNEGGGLVVWGAEATLVNCTVADNTSVWSGGGVRAVNGSVTLRNTVIWRNTPDAVYSSDGAAPVASYSDIQGGYSGTGNINADPIFSTHPDSAYHLTGASPCIDAGDPASPKDPDSTQADMGAFYFHHVNAPPVWAARADTSTSEGVGLTFAVSATDPDGQNLSYRAPTLPIGATFDTTSHVFDWTPGYDQAGQHDVRFSVTDGEFTVYDTVQVTVTDVSRAPVWAARADTATSEGVPLTFTVSATDPDGQNLSYRAPTLPTGASFDTLSHVFDWTPGFDQAGQHEVRFSVTDGEFTVYDTVRVTVTDVNRAPVWASRPDTSTSEGVRLTFTISATDPDGQTLHYSVPAMPAGATFDSESRTFAWTPPYDFVPYDSASADTVAILRVWDGDFSVRDTVKITVFNVNRRPVWTRLPDTTAFEGTKLDYVVAASDPDGTAPAYSLIAPPAGPSVDPTGGRFVWLLGHDLVTTDSTFRLTFRAGDGTDHTDSTVSVLVRNANRPPVWTGLPDTTAFEGTTLDYVVAASDPDGMATSYSLVAPPAGASLDPASGRFVWQLGHGLVTTDSTFRLTFRAGDGTDHTDSTVSVLVRNANRRPIWTKLPDTTAFEGTTLDYVVAASDSDGTAPAYSLIAHPAGASVDPTGGRFVWQLGHDLVTTDSTFRLTFRADDRTDHTDSTVSILVRNANRPPVWTKLPDTTAFEGTTLDYVIVASDSDGTAPVYSLIAPPAGASLDPTSGRFVWQLGHDMMTTDSTFRLNFRADDRTDHTDSTVSILVRNANRKPGPIAIIGDTTSATRSVAFRIQATDPDGDAVRYRLATPLDGASLDSVSGQFLWNRRSSQAENQTVTFSAWDGAASVMRVVQIRAAAVNVAPTADWSEALRDTVSWSTTLKLSLTDAEADSARIIVQFSTADGGTWHPAAVSGGIGPVKPPSTVTLTWDTRADLPGKALWPSVTVRLVPVDEDSGAALVKTVCVLNLPCDWDRDGRIGLRDFDTLRVAWLATPQDTTKNLGPYTPASSSAVPNIVPTQDGRVDFEDLMAFGVLWEWALGKGRVARLAHLPSTSAEAPSDQPVRLSRDAGGVVVTLAEGVDAVSVGLAVTVPHTAGRFVRVERGPWCGLGGLWLSRYDTSTSVVDVWVASDLGSSTARGCVGKIVMSSEERQVEFEIAYEIHLAGGTCIAGRSCVSLTLPRLPDRWALSPVVPNPFNPSTALRYDVPAPAHVRIAVYNLLGQRVAVLRDEAHEAGSYCAVWDGKDASGADVGTGLYVISLETPGMRLVRRAVLVR